MITVTVTLSDSVQITVNISIAALIGVAFLLCFLFAISPRRKTGNV